MLVCQINLLYTDRLFHCNMLDESICHLRGVNSILSLFSILMENPISKQYRPHQMPHYVCLPMTLLRGSGKNGKLLKMQAFI